MYTERIASVSIVHGGNHSNSSLGSYTASSSSSDPSTPDHRNPYGITGILHTNLDDEIFGTPPSPGVAQILTMQTVHGHEYVLGIPVVGEANKRYVLAVMLCSVLNVVLGGVSFFIGLVASFSLLISLGVSYCGYRGAAENNAQLLLCFTAFMLIHAIWDAVLLFVIMFDILGYGSMVSGDNTKDSCINNPSPNCEAKFPREVTICILTIEFCLSFLGAICGQRLLRVLQTGQVIADENLPPDVVSGNIIGAATIRNLNHGLTPTSSIRQGVTMGQPVSPERASPVLTRMSSDNPFSPTTSSRARSADGSSPRRHSSPTLNNFVTPTPADEMNAELATSVRVIGTQFDSSPTARTSPTAQALIELRRQSENQRDRENGGVNALF